jgi:hypothetical protein
MESHDGIVSSVLQIDSGVYLITGGFHDPNRNARNALECGGGEKQDSMVVLSRAGSQYRVAWNGRGPEVPQLAPWNQGLAKLPVAANGHPRFYIDGLYPLCTGSASLNQLSIWEWNCYVASKPVVVLISTEMFSGRHIILAATNCRAFLGRRRGATHSGGAR